MADEAAQPRQLSPFQAMSGPLATDKNFSVTPQRVDHRHPAVAAPETVEVPEDIAPDAEPVPTPATPTPRPDGQPPAPDATVPVIATSYSENSTVAVVSQTEGSAPATA